VNREQALAYVGRNHRGVLATLKRDGMPQLSPVAYLLDDDGEVKISVTHDRAKTRNIRREPRVAMSVVGENWYEYVVVEGRARIVEDDPVPLLRHVYRGVRGEGHPDWREFDEAMVRDDRVVLVIAIDRVYPLDA
jgi:PPOX class probable F420-dependent enzyme